VGGKKAGNKVVVKELRSHQAFDDIGEGGRKRFPKKIKKEGSRKDGKKHDSIWRKLLSLAPVTSPRIS